MDFSGNASKKCIIIFPGKIYSNLATFLTKISNGIRIDIARKKSRAA